MSLFSALTAKPSGFEDVFKVKDITSSEMQAAIKEWFSLYFDRETPADEDGSQRLPVVIVNKLCKTIFSEYEISLDGKGESTNLSTELLKKLNAIKEQAVQFELVGGECLIKPVIDGNNFYFIPIRRDCFLPLARDAFGKITSVGMTEVTCQEGKYYTLLERRTVNANGTLVIESKLFMSREKTTLGVEVLLNTLDRYAQLKPYLELPGIYNLGMVQLKTPLFNCVDGSPDGVAVYAPAVGLIRNINRNERQINDEFENGASRIIASADMLQADTLGKKRLIEKQFVALDDDPENVGVTIFNPDLREEAYLARKQEYLRNIESAIGLKRGILSEVEAAERTATEITSSEGDYNLTIQDFQHTWEAAVKELLETCIRLGQVYKMNAVQGIDVQSVVIDWGDGVLFNRDKVWQEYQQMVASGMLKPEIALAWYFNLPANTPKDIENIREQYMPELENLIGGE